MVSSLAFREGLLRLGLAISEELLLCRAGALGGSLREVGVVDFLVNLSIMINTASDSGVALAFVHAKCGVGKLGTHLEVAKLDLGRSGNNVRLVHPPEGNTVNLVGTGDQEQPARELLEEDDALPPEAAREEDENGAGGDG